MSADVRNEYLEVLDHAELLHPPEAVAWAVERCAEGVAAEYAERDPLVLCVMVGGFRFASDLLGHLDFPLEVDYLHATRYGDETRGGSLRWLRRPELSLRGRHVLVVDDILDQGVTLAAILRACEEAGASTVGSAVLLDKQVAGRVLAADFAALTIADRYVFGEGMDFKGYGRNLRGIWALAEPR